MTEQPDGHVFLSPEWIRQVIEATESAKMDDPYFRELVADFTMNVKYVVRDLPGELRAQYGGKSRMVMFVALDRGSVRQIHFGRRPANQEVHLEVASDYETAKRLFLRECSPARVFLNRGVTAKPVGGFRHWSKVNANSLLTASRLLRMARKVPTVFNGM